MRLVIPVALIAASCGGGAATDTTVAPTSPTVTEPAPTTTAAPTTTIPATTTSTLGPIDWVYTPVAEIPTVTVIDPGAEPRTVLEFTPTVGSATALSMLMTMEFTVEVAGEASDTAMQVRIPMEARVLEVTESRYVGEITHGTPEVVSASDAAMKAALEGEYAGLEGLSLRSMLSRSGELLAHEPLDGLPGSEFLPDTLGSLTAPVPREPVGVGAVWEVTTRANVDTMPLNQTTRFTIVDIQGSEVTVDVEISQEFVDAEVTGVENLSVSGSGSGRAIWNLLDPFAMTVTSTVTSVTSATIELEDETSEFNQTMRMEMEMRPE